MRHISLGRAIGLNLILALTVGTLGSILATLVVGGVSLAFDSEAGEDFLLLVLLAPLLFAAPAMLVTAPVHTILLRRPAIRRNIGTAWARVMSGAIAAGIAAAGYFLTWGVWMTLAGYGLGIAVLFAVACGGAAYGLAARWPPEKIDVPFHS